MPKVVARIAQSWHTLTHGQTHTHTGTGTDNTRRPKLASGKNESESWKKHTANQCDKSTLVQVMACYPKAISNYLNQYWPSTVHAVIKTANWHVGAITKSLDLGRFPQHNWVIFSQALCVDDIYNKSNRFHSFIPEISQKRAFGMFNKSFVLQMNKTNLSMIPQF